MSVRILVLVAMITAFAPLSMDLYLPGLPDLREELGATDQQAQFTVTVCILGLALGQFLTSLVPDRVGRRRPLIAGMIVWIVVTTLCAFAPNVWAVLVLRLIQGTGAGFAIALARTVVADLDPKNLSTNLSRMMLVLSVVPVLAPVLGGVMVSFTDWRGLFLGLAVTGLILLAVVFTSLPETHQSGQVRDQAETLLGPMKHLLTSTEFLLPAVISGTGFGVTFSFIGDSAFVFRDHYGVGPVPYGLIFGLDAAAMILGIQLGPVVERRIGTKRTLLFVTMLGAVGAAIMLTSALVLPTIAAPVVVALMFVLIGGGAVIPIATAAAIDTYPGEVAAASGICGAFQFLLGGLIGAVPTLLPLPDGAAALSVVCLGALTLGHVLSRRLARVPRRGDILAEPVTVPAVAQDARVMQPHHEMGDSQ